MGSKKAVVTVDQRLKSTASDQKVHLFRTRDTTDVHGDVILLFCPNHHQLLRKLSNVM